MRPRTMLALAAIAALALPAAAEAGGKKNPGHNWKKGRWDARALVKPTAKGENARGQAYLKRGKGTVTVALRMGKLDPNTAYAAQIEAGSCPAGGAAAVTLPHLYTDGNGIVRMWLTLPSTSDVATNGFVVHVRALTAEGTAGDTVACGDVKGSSATKAAAHVRPSVNGSKVRGSVLARQKGTSLRVEVRLSGLAPGSTQAHHIHVGSCKAQGDVVVPLPDATADDKGRYRAVLTVDNPAANVVNGGYYYNMHAAASPTPGDGVACGNLRPVDKKKIGPWWFGPGWWGW